ncbi:FAD-dependent oxidoreductase [Bacteroidota bacterium]
MSTEKTIAGVFICKSCRIGEDLNVEGLSALCKEDEHVVHCKSIDSMCQESALELLRKDIEEKDLNRIIIAACSPRVKTNEFTFNHNILVERVNLREQVVYCHKGNDEDTQMLAEDLLRMGIAKITTSEMPEPFISEEIFSDILVVGGGITGITAAIEGARAGYSVVLVEKEKKLGGRLANILKQLPLTSPWLEAQKPVVFEKIKELQDFPDIKILNSSEIKEISGQPGQFSVKINAGGEEKHHMAGAIVMATGWKPYDAKLITEYSYEKYQNVISSVEFEELAVKGNITRPSDGKKIKNLLFIQCAGSRDEKHLSYCSSICCGTSLKQAKYIREADPDTNVYIIYKDIRMPGMYENYYKEVQKDERIFFAKGTVASITEEDGSLVVDVKDSFIDNEVFIRADMVVLATGMTPADTTDLNLNYRLGKGLPLLKYDFPDSHFICFPYETRRTGIYAAGAVRAPLSVADSIDDASGAMLKAIQCVEAVKRGESVHPRSGDKSFPELYMERCTDCKRCTEECPFGMYDETEKGTPLPNPNRCRRCGICMGSCPERIISFSDYSINIISSMIKSIHIPDEFEEKPRILAFVCENDAYPAFDMAGLKGLEYSSFVRIIPVRCIGSINKVWISDALSQGFDGILQIGCKPGDDYQCHFIQGSELTEKRGENIQEALETMMLEPERIKTEFLEIDEYNRIPELINNYIEVIEEIGPNPFKEL